MYWKDGSGLIYKTGYLIYKIDLAYISEKAFRAHMQIVKNNLINMRHRPM